MMKTAYGTLFGPHILLKACVRPQRTGRFPRSFVLLNEVKFGQQWIRHMRGDDDRIIGWLCTDVVTKGAGWIDIEHVDGLFAHDPVGIVVSTAQVCVFSHWGLKR
jgi:hypothetical protein